MALGIGLFVAAAALVVLVAPVHLRVALVWQRDLETRVQLSALFGLVRVRMRPGAAGSAGVRPQKTDRPRRRRQGSAAGRRAASAMLRNEAVRARGLRFLRDVLRATKARDVHLTARIGCDDPADTGRLWGALGLIGALLARHDIRLEPEFRRACLQFHAAVRLRVIPVQLLYLVAAFCLSPVVLRALVAR